MSNNRVWNAKNPYQGDFKRVLCVCSAGLLRSPTLAWILSKSPYNFNTRAAGLEVEHALIAVDEALLEWADEIACMNERQQVELQKLTDKPVHNLDIADSFAYRDQRLIKALKQKIKEIWRR